MISPITKFKKRLKRRREAKQKRFRSLEFHVGEQDQLDFITYSGLEEQYNYLVVDGRFLRVMYLSGYPYTASSGWLNQLVNFNHDADISYHIEPVEATLALPKLNRKITELTSTKRAMERSGRIIGSELLDPLESATALRDKIQRGQENLFQVSIYIALSADSLPELDKTTKVLETVLATRLFYTKYATFQQIEGLQSVLPRSDNQLAQKRNLDSSSAALTFPFISSELVHESGVLYGVNRSNNSLVILDRFALPNANSILFAQSGAGKSYTAKVEILRNLMRGTKVIVIDPEREYRQLAESVKGAYIKLSVHSKEKINPFDLSVNAFTEPDSFADHIQSLTEIISLMAEGLSAEEKSVVDQAILKTYKKTGWSIRKGSRQKPGDYPLLRDLYVTLKTLKQPRLCRRLDKYIKGSLSQVFEEQTNIQLDNRLVVFDTKDLPESLREIMHLVVAQFVQNQVKSEPCKRLLVIDEAWLMLQHEESARFISGLVRRARKYYLGVSIISQQANDFLQNAYGRAIASQSALRILMRQDTTTIRNVAQEFRLSEYEQKFLLTCERGEALIIADQHHVVVKIMASEDEHPLITTDPAEKYLAKK
ncbi:MAG TPA: ATP-binding protein [Candidatus Saccharimonadales bacterium]|nr:ATP-binding protein [Candidatus Saccharimonadales bacterium]